MTTDQPKKKIQITMSERRPLSIVEDEWPTIAQAKRYNGEVEAQANRIWSIKVRQHADGRRLVYGYVRRGNAGMPIDWRGAEGGFLVAPVAGKPDEAETVRAIRRIAGILDDDALGDQCIAELPAEDA